MDVKTLRPLNTDIIVMYHDLNDLSGSDIIVEDRSTGEQKTHFCKVLRVSPQVTEVKEGDIVVVSWLDITPPFEIDVDGKMEKAHITTEERVLGVVEE